MKLAQSFKRILLPIAAVAGLWSQPLLSAENVENIASNQNGKSDSGQSSSASSSDLVPMGLLQVPAHSQYYSAYAFLVDKAERKLSIWHQTGNGLKEVANFPADMGKKLGAKRILNDHRTPEGIYFLLEQLEGQSLDFNQYGKRAFTTDYPNLFDRMEGKTGYGIWLHAVPDDVPLTRGSRGCVVVRNDVIVDLAKYIRLKRTPILIQDKTVRVPPAELDKLNRELNQWIESWRTAWVSKDLDRYISFYGDQFRSMKMNLAQWRAHKEKLNAQYNQIDVKISKPAIFADRDVAVVRFLQEYTSDQHADFGEKVLYLKKSGDQYRIVGETWASETSQVAREEIQATTSSSMTLKN